MAEYKAPLRDMQFILKEVFDADGVWSSMEATRDVDGDVVDAILEEGSKLAENLLFPLNRSGDEEGCSYKDSVVTTPEGFKDAYKVLSEGGWVGLGGDPAYGGQGMPKMLTVLFEEMMYSANTSFCLYMGLTSGACLAINAHADEALKDKYLPKLYEGSWAGTMCLTEAHSGTDLGIIRTKAEPEADGSYRITGSKIFITGGEHDLTENIVHLVLAKVPDAPAGPRGISLFLVPKFLSDDANNLTERNPVFCGSIEHKMGIKGSSTCVINFDNAKGWLVGDLNKGLAAMFTMMNYERLSIGLQGIGLGEVAYQSAAGYARERIQGRSASGPVNPDKAADPIIVHPDVRRMLLVQRANNEAGRAFAAYVGMHLDIAKFSDDEERRRSSAAMVALLTPVAKAYFTDKGFEGCVMGQQCFGGHGFIREWGMEQFVRDCRIAQIYEGTNGIQALDLMGRKVAANKGAGVEQFLAEIRAFAETLADRPGLAPFVEPTLAVVFRLEQATRAVIESAATDPNAVGAASVDYLELFGLTAYAYMWLRMAAVAEEAVAGDSSGFYKAKLNTARFFMGRVLPRSLAVLESILAGSDDIMALEAEYF